jgi:hypothetical protein
MYVYIYKYNVYNVYTVMMEPFKEPAVESATPKEKSAGKSRLPPLPAALDAKSTAMAVESTMAVCVSEG